MVMEWGELAWSGPRRTSGNTEEHVKHFILHSLQILHIYVSHWRECKQRGRWLAYFGVGSCFFPKSRFNVKALLWNLGQKWNRWKYVLLCKCYKYLTLQMHISESQSKMPNWPNDFFFWSMRVGWKSFEVGKRERGSKTWNEAERERGPFCLINLHFSWEEHSNSDSERECWED